MYVYVPSLASVSVNLRADPNFNKTVYQTHGTMTKLIDEFGQRISPTMVPRTSATAALSIHTVLMWVLVATAAVVHY